MADGEARALHVSTEPFARAGRVDEFRERFGRAILRVDIDQLDGCPLEIDCVLRELPNFAMAAGSISPVRVRNPTELNDNDDLVLCAIKSGAAEFLHLGRDVRLTAGDAVFGTTGETGTLINPSAVRFCSLRFSRQLLAQYVGNLDDLIARRIPGSHPALRLLVGYAGVLEDPNELATAELRGAVSLHMHDLAALVLDGGRDPIEHARGIRAARLRAIKKEVLRRIGQQGLLSGDVAYSQGISTSYLRQLFAAEGTTFTDFVLAQRLALAHRMLLDRRNADRPISSIAFACGFGDLSYFNRTFRRRFGATPSDVREAAHRN